MLVVFGSVNADLVYQIERIPRPGETVLCEGWSFAAGGKGANQAAAAAKAGGEVAFVGCVGGDAHGPTLRQGLEAVGVDCSRMRLSPRPSGTAVIAVERDGENAIIVASGANLDVSVDQLPQLNLGDTLLCQNEIPTEATFAALRRARVAGARTILNLAPAASIPDHVLKDVDVLVVNEHEAQALVGNQGSPIESARSLAASHGLSCVVTLGVMGAIAIAAGAEWRVAALPVHVVDTTGAGDAFVGVLAAALAGGGTTWPVALARASVAAGLACEKLGAREGHPTAAAIDARLGELTPVSLPAG